MTARIMVIEGDMGALGLIEQVLTEQGYNITITRHGAETAELFDMFRPQLVIADVIMPDTDEIDNIADLRKRAPTVKIIAISNNEYLLHIAQKSGANFILEKPFGKEQLTALVRTALS